MYDNYRLIVIDKLSYPTFLKVNLNELQVSHSNIGLNYNLRQNGYFLFNSFQIKIR
jgi:hypothetical protein